MDRLIIPLRSNAAWFATSGQRIALERRIKAAAIIHDELVFQDGRYMINVWEQGSMDWMIPPDSIPGDRETIRYRSPGTPAALRMRSSDREKEDEFIPILQGKTIESLEVDFFPILKDSGLLEEDFVRLTYYSASPEAKSRLKSAATADLLRDDLSSALPVERFRRRPIVEAVHFDSALAGHLGAPMMADPRVAGFIGRKSRDILGSTWGLDLRPAILGVTMGLILPDFAEMDWENILRVRESGSGRDLRSHIALAATELAATAENVEDPRDLEVVIQRHYLRELSEQLRGERPTVQRLLVGLTANLIPGLGGTVTSAADLAKLIQHKKSWVSLVQTED